jgi:hypothetical protein
MRVRIQFIQFNHLALIVYPLVVRGGSIWKATFPMHALLRETAHAACINAGRRSWTQERPTGQRTLNTMQAYRCLRGKTCTTGAKSSFHVSRLVRGQSLAARGTQQINHDKLGGPAGYIFLTVPGCVLASGSKRRDEDAANQPAVSLPCAPSRGGIVSCNGRACTCNIHTQMLHGPRVYDTFLFVRDQ